MPSLSRRHFIKSAGLASAGLFIPPQLFADAQEAAIQEQSRLSPEEELISFNEMYDNPPLLGRVHPWNRVSIWKQPSPNGGRVRNVFGGRGANRSYIAPIYRAVHGEPYDYRFHSDVWYETLDGYMHSAHLLPVREIFNPPPSELGADQVWGEVTVPETFQHTRPDITSNIWDFDHFKGFYGQVYPVVGMAEGPNGNVWYQIHDDVAPERIAWMLAHHLRILPTSAFDAISPDVPAADKSITISLDAQTLTCYEYGKPVFTTRIASGSNIRDDDGTIHNFETLTGQFLIERKRPSRRMRGGEPGSVTAYDVNAVPWVTYFGHNGAAIHGAYWHNNFGIPRSHGCINVTADAAHWIYRWSQPHMGYEVVYAWREDGEPSTRIQVI